MSQHGGQTHATCCAQQCCVSMLRSFGLILTYCICFGLNPQKFSMQAAPQVWIQSGGKKTERVTEVSQGCVLTTRHYLIMHAEA